MHSFTYTPPREIRALNWSNRNDQIFRLAVASVYEDFRQEVSIVRLNPNHGIHPYQESSITYAVSANTLAFFPSKECHHPDLLAFAGDTLSLWKFTGISSQRISELAIDPSRVNLTVNTIEWNAAAHQRIAAACFGGSCTVWDIERGIPEAQLYTSRNTELVHDVSWGGPDILAATFEAGTVEVVDLRSGRTSLFFWVPQSVNKVDWNALDTNHIAVTTGGKRAVLLDTRRPFMMTADMRRHQDMITSIAWDPDNPRRLCTAGADSRALLWEVPTDGHDEVISEYVAGRPIEQMKWSCVQPAWMALGFQYEVQIKKAW